LATATTILDRAERTLDFERASIGVPGLESTNLLTVLNSAVKEYFVSFEKMGEPSSILRKETGYALVADTALNGALASGATSIVVDSSASFGTSGAIAVWDNDRPDYIEFGGNNLTTTFSSVTGVSFAHEDNDIVSLLYALPSNFDGFRSEEGFEDGVSVDGTPYFFTSGDPRGLKYAIYDNGTTKYLHFPMGLTGDVFVRYNAAPTVVSAESSTVDIPTKDEDYAMWAVVKYASTKLDRPDMFNMATAEMYRILNSAHILKNIAKRPRLRPMRRKIGYARSVVFD
jgi:hypothetical protein